MSLQVMRFPGVGGTPAGGRDATQPRPSFPRFVEATLAATAPLPPVPTAMANPHYNGGLSLCR